jgi:hypothetical protein
MLTRKSVLSWARGSTRRSEAEPGGIGGVGQAAWLPVAAGSGSGSGMRQRVTSKPRAASLPTWWAIWRRVVGWRW